MKEAIVDKETKVTFQDVPVPKPGDKEVLIRVDVFGTNPKDWKYPSWMDFKGNTGDDIAGIVEDVGKDVFEFKKGDRVAGFHVMGNPGAAFAEYALVPAHTTFHLPPSVSLEEAATIPLAALTSAYALFYDLGLPSVWTKKPKDAKPTPVIIYGASSAIGAFAIKLAAAADIHPIIAVGSSTSDFLKENFNESKGDALVDYKAHESQESLVHAIKEQLTKSGAPGGRAFYAFDGISENGTFDKVLSPILAGPPQEGTGLRPRLSLVLPYDEKDIDSSIDVTRTYVGAAHEGRAGETFAAAWCTLFSKGLFEGWFKPHPYEVMPGGFDGLEEGLKKLRNGEVRAKKLVGRPKDTKGI